MPSKSPAQAKLMRAVAHGWKPDRMKGPPRKVAKEFVAADKKAKGYQFGGKIVKRLMREARLKQEGKLPDAPRRSGSRIARFIQEGRREQESKTAAAQAAAFTGDPATGPLWNEYLVDTQAKGDPEIIGPRTMGASLGDPTQYAIQAGMQSKNNPEGMTEERRGALLAAGYTPGTGRYSNYLMPPAELLGGAAPPEGGLAEATQPVRTIQPVAGREFISGDAPPRQAAPAGPAFDPGRVPVALQRYLTKVRAAAGEQPVKMQMGGALNFLRQGRVPPMQQFQQRGQPPGGGMTSDMGMQKFLRRGQVPGGGGGGGRFKGIGRAMNEAIQKLPGQGQPPGGGGPQQRPQPPGAGVPLRGVGRPPGMGGPGAGGARPDVQPGRQFVATPGGGVPTAGTPLRPEGIPFNPAGGGGAGMPGGGFGGRGRGQNLRGLMQQMRQQRQQQTGGGRPRIGMGDQQGALARATQVQTGRPPISRRQAFPGRGGRGRGRFQR